MRRVRSIRAIILFGLVGNKLDSINSTVPADRENSTVKAKSGLRPLNVQRLKISSR
ncbi:hypothetical protein [Pseudobacteroides cellulosolvens]|uniref:hypothetical protein n=1 Tax=Pseudobacteroides cellulosolvens TaxID=35825 RepID=UPI001FA7585D|nr:hypothetical protein [Pseudobacteroides cellulosolvens]